MHIQRQTTSSADVVSVQDRAQEIIVTGDRTVSSILATTTETNPAAASAAMDQAGNSTSPTHGDAFDSNMGPTMFMAENRTSVLADLGLVMITIIFMTCLLLLLVLLPSIRRNKLRNFICLCLMICIGASVPYSLSKSSWLSGETELNIVPYDSYFRAQFKGLIRVEIGLNSMNVSLIGQVTTSATQSTTPTTTTTTTTSSDKTTDSDNPFIDYDGLYLETDQQQQQQVKFVHYNERFQFDKPDDMQSEHQQALKRGLPYPILSVTEYFSHDSDGFNWTRQIRQISYYTSFLLYATFASWLVTMLMMCILPAYFMTMLRVTCILSATSYLYHLFSVALRPQSTILIYGQEMTVGPNHITTLAAILSIVAYYFALYIDSDFRMSSHDDDSMTIMDSEDYLKDKKVLGLGAQFSEYSIRNQHGVDPIEPQEPAMIMRQDSVIIPIADIQEKFGMPK